MQNKSISVPANAHMVWMFRHYEESKVKVQQLHPPRFKIKYLAFQYINFQSTWWRLLQKRIVRTKYDIYVSMTTTGSITYWWTISRRWYHLNSSQCFGADMVYYIYFYWNVQFLNNVIILKTKVLLPRS